MILKKIKKYITKDISLSVITASIILSIVLAVIINIMHDGNYDTNKNVEKDNVNDTNQINISFLKNNNNEHIYIIPNYVINNVIKTNKLFNVDYAKIEKCVKITEYNNKLRNLHNCNRMSWYIGYKRLHKEYEKYLKKRKNIYDDFDEDQLWFLFAIVEAEVSGKQHFSAKANVASVIFNRIKDDEFPNDIYGVLTSPGQFTSYSNGAYLENVITETTKLACEYAYEFGDTTYGAIYFDSKMENSWAYGIQELIMIDEVGHSFYR